MKKIFSIITAVFGITIITLLVTLACVKKNVPLGNGDPYKIMVYNHSTTALKSSITDDPGFTKDDKEYAEILKKLNKTTTLSLLDWLVHENTLDLHPTQDQKKIYSSYTTEMKTEYIAIELWFANENAQQDLVVFVDGNSKVISYDRIILVLPTDDNAYNDIVAYFSLGSSDPEKQYKSCEPVVLRGRAGELVKFIKSI